MKPFTDEEEFKSMRKHYPQDSTGQRVHVGDRVELNQDYGFGKASQGIIVTFSVGPAYDFGVAFDKGSGGHNLEGLLPAGSSHGYWVEGSQINLIFSETTIDEEIVIKNLLDEVKTEPKLALIDGKFYALELKPKAMADEFINKLMESVSIRISKIRQEAQNKVAVAEQKLRVTFIMPEVTLADIKKGMSIFKQDGEYLSYLVPLHYAPKFLSRNVRITRQICEEHRKVLERDILLKIMTKREGRVVQVSTLKPDLEIFYHYHGNIENCRGTVKIEQIDKPSDVFKARDRLQKALEIVNINSLYDRDPPYLPLAKELEEKSVELPADSFIEPLVVIAVGDMVKVVEEHDESSLLGLIGKVVSSSDLLAGVEFLEKFSGGHDSSESGKQGHCWNFPVDNLEVMPPGTKRTRQGATTLSGWASVDFASPEDEEFAKFGLNSNSMHSLCARCGVRRGGHYGDRAPSICLDEFQAGRRATNLNVIVNRAWVREPYLREAVGA